MTPWNFTVTPEACAALQAKGITPPSVVTVVPRTATHREITWFDAAQKDDGLAATAPLEFTAELLRRRADPPISAEIALEVAQDIPYSVMAEMAVAFVSGERGDPKKISRAVNKTLTGILDRLLDSLNDSETPPSSPPYTG